MSGERTQPGKKERKNMQIKQQIFHNLIEITELYPQYTTTQHLSAILRRKNDSGKQFHSWTEEELLKKIEQHKTELENEQFEETEDDEY